jgi:hypothetical protein
MQILKDQSRLLHMLPELDLLMLPHSSGIGPVLDISQELESYRLSHTIQPDGMKFDTGSWPEEYIIVKTSSLLYTQPTNSTRANEQPLQLGPHWTSTITHGHTAAFRKRQIEAFPRRRRIAPPLAPHRPFASHRSRIACLHHRRRQLQSRPAAHLRHHQSNRRWCRSRFPRARGAQRS